MTTDRFNRPFAPLDNATSLIAVAATTKNVALKLTDTTKGQVPNIRIFNNGTATVWISFGGASVVAVLVDDIPIGPGMAEVFTMPGNEDDILRFAAIAAGATGNVYATVGYGI